MQISRSRLVWYFLSVLGCLFQAAQIRAEADLQAEEVDHAEVGVELRLEERGKNSEPSVAKVFFNSLPEAGRSTFVGWNYVICSRNLTIVDVKAGADLEEATGPAGSFDCQIRLEEGMIFVEAVCTGEAAEGRREDGFKNWEELVITCQCPPDACFNGELFFCEGSSVGSGTPVEFATTGETLPAAPEGRHNLPLCGLSEKLLVDPVFLQSGHVGVYLRGAPDVPPCPIEGWSYGVCVNGDVQIESAQTGEDCLRVNGGYAPAWNSYELYKSDTMSGVARAVIVDLLGFQTLNAAEIGGGWEDLVLTLSGVPGGKLTICDRMVGDPLVEATWSYKEDSVPMLLENRGEVEFSWKRGDTNFDGLLDIADAINSLRCLFGLGESVYCACREDLCRPVFDVNTDTGLDVADPIYLLQYLFTAGPAPEPLR